jgi:hypothetical protein
VRQFIPSPTLRSTYEIFRSTLNELLRCGVITSDQEKSPQVTSVDFVYHLDFSNESVSLYSDDTTQHAPIRFFPAWEEVHVFCWNESENGAAWKLEEIAKRCDGLSGRILRRLPMLAITMWTYTDPCGMNEALEALSVVVNEQLNSCLAKDPSN